MYRVEVITGESFVENHLHVSTSTEITKHGIICINWFSLLLTMKYPTWHTTQYLTLDLLIITPLHAKWMWSYPNLMVVLFTRFQVLAKKCGLRFSRFVIVQLLRYPVFGMLIIMYLYLQVSNCVPMSQTCWTKLLLFVSIFKYHEKKSFNITMIKFQWRLDVQRTKPRVSHVILRGRPGNEP
jgi:hypothetical protein